MYKNIITALLLCASQLLLAGGEKLYISKFENSKELKKWQVRKISTPAKWSFNTDKKYIASGRGSGKLEFEPAGKKARPAIIWLKRRSVLKNKDFRTFSILSMDVYNPQESACSFRVYFRGKNKRHSSSKNVKVKPGWNKIKVKLPAQFAKNPLSEIHLFQYRSKNPCTFYLDNIALEPKAKIIKKKAEFLGRELKKISGLANSELRQEALLLAESFQRLAQDISVNTASLAISYPILEDKYKLLRRKIEEFENKKMIAVFNKKFPGKWGYIWTHGAKKIYREQKFCGGKIGGKAKISLAKNETEALQIVLRAKEKLENVRFKVSDLKCGDNILKAENIEIIPVGYIKARPTPFSVVMNYTWTPDPLLTFLDSFSLDAKVWQPLYVDIHTPADSAPGIYAGNLEISADSVKPLIIPLQVKIWNFTIPSRSTLPTAIAYRSDKGRKSYKDIDPKAKELATQKLLLKHKITPDSIYGGRTPIKVLKRWDKLHAGPYCVIHIAKRRKLKEGEPYPPEKLKRYMARLDKYVPVLKKTKFYKDCYIYCFDEITVSQAFAAKQIMSLVKTKYPDIPIMTTAYDPTFGKDPKFGLDSCIDIWVPKIGTYVKNLENAKIARKHGKKIWWYVCNRPLPPTVNLLLASTTSASRLLLGILANKYKPDGFLYYQVANWGAPGEKLLSQGPLTAHRGINGHRATEDGDGMLFYPGKEGTVPTLRAKALRDGLEDYEYYHIIEQKFPKSELLKIPEKVCVDLENYDTSGDELINYREKLGEFISKTNSK